MMITKKPFAHVIHSKFITVQKAKVFEFLDVNISILLTLYTRGVVRQMTGSDDTGRRLAASSVELRYLLKLKPLELSGPLGERSKLIPLVEFWLTILGCTDTIFCGAQAGICSACLSFTLFTFISRLLSILICRLDVLKIEKKSL